MMRVALLTVAFVLDYLRVFSAFPWLESSETWGRVFYLPRSWV